MDRFPPPRVEARTCAPPSSAEDQAVSRGWTRPRAARAVLVGLSLAATTASLAGAQTRPTPAGTPPPMASSPASVASAAAVVPNPAPLAAYPDIVRLRSGAFLRGTVVEHDPAGQTVIRTDTGVRTVSGADVVYAGPVAGDPGNVAPISSPASSAAPPPATSASVQAKTDELIHFRAFAPGVRYFVLPVSKPDGEGMRFVCTAPCDPPLERGAYRVSLAAGDRGPYLVRDNVELVPGSTIEGRILDRRNTRLFGWGLAGVSLIPTLGGLLATAFGKGNVRTLGPVVAIGGAAGVGAGLLISRAQDIAEVNPVEPAKPSKSARGFAIQMSHPF
jgi:hypothetical protein